MKSTKEQLQFDRTVNLFLEYDQEKMIELHSLRHDNDSIYIEFIKKQYRIDRHTGVMYEGEREANLDEMCSVFEFLTHSPHLSVVTGKWESIDSLCTNTTDTSLGRYLDYLKPFGGDSEKMKAALVSLGGILKNQGDASAVIEIFQDVPVWFQYWEADEEFPESVTFLFDAGSADHFRWSLLWNVMTCITDRMKEEAGLAGT